MQTAPGLKRRLTDIDWERWQADDIATLLFIVEPERVLLIRKKRGLGAGKINAPGGRLEAGETPEQAAIRETEEEIGVTPLSPNYHGSLRFEFVDGYKLHAHVFVAASYVGNPIETDEATPLWYRVADIPFDEMWADDALWLPHVLDGRQVQGRFVFDADAMLDHELLVD